MEYYYYSQLSIMLTGVVECEAGVILENLSDKVGEHGYTVPLDLGARGSCFIGGKINVRKLFSRNMQTKISFL